MPYSAIQRVFDLQRADCEKYGIECNPAARVIIYNGVAKQFPPYTDARKITAHVKICIKDAKAKLHKKQMENQGTLL